MTKMGNVKIDAGNVERGVTIDLKKSATTDGMQIEIRAFPPRVAMVEWWISESPIGAGLTADTYSGDVTTSVGTEIEEVTSKKHFRCITNADGLLIATAVDSANPADQYVAAVDPVSGTVVVSGVSGNNWEGA